MAKGVRGGFYFHPSDESLSLGTPEKEKSTWLHALWVQLLWFRSRAATLRSAAAHTDLKNPQGGNACVALRLRGFEKTGAGQLRLIAMARFLLHRNGGQVESDQRKASLAVSR